MHSKWIIFSKEFLHFLYHLRKVENFQMYTYLDYNHLCFCCVHFFSFHLFGLSWIWLNPVLIWLYPLQFTTQCIAITQNKIKQRKRNQLYRIKIFLFILCNGTCPKREMYRCLCRTLFASYYIHKIWYFQQPYHAVYVYTTHRLCANFKLKLEL